MENKKKLLAYGEKLPWELTEEILSRVPPTSLARFKLVAKQWNTLINDKKFIHNHKAMFRFILATKFKIYSVSIDPKIEVRELTLDIPGLESKIPKYLVDRNEFMLCRMEKGAAIWNPWLKQTRWIEDEVNQHNFEFEGIGYNNGIYNILGSCAQKEDPTGRTLWKIYDFTSNAWKEHDSGPSQGNGGRRYRTLINGSVSLNGSLYWVSYFYKTGDGWCIMQFDFSSDEFNVFCDLPCGTNDRRDASVLNVFKEDRFSLLKQRHATKNIEVWLTKNKINSKSGNDVEWMKFMEVSSPNLPGLVQPGSDSQPSYFIEDKTLVVCFCENGRAWIYVMGEANMIRKIQIDPVDAPWASQYSYTPTLVQVPSVQREETGSQI